MSDINADINALVDRIWIDGDAFNPSASFIEDIRNSDQYQVKYLLIEIEHTLKKQKYRKILNVYTEQLSYLAHCVSMDHIDVPLTEEEQARADYENAMLIQSKRDRREWEAIFESIIEKEAN
jgi:hypothetical protein